MKEAINLAKSNGLEKLTYTDSDGNSKTLTVATDENGRFIFSDGTNSYDENGDPFSNTPGSIVDIVNTSENTPYKIVTDRNAYSSGKGYGKALYNECEEIRNSMMSERDIMREYFKKNKNIITDENVANFLEEQYDLRGHLSASLDADLKHGWDVDDGPIGDLVSFSNLTSDGEVYDVVKGYNQAFANIYSIDNINKALKKLGYPQIEETN